MSEEIQSQLGQLGRGMVQVNLKLGRILDAVQSDGGSGGGEEPALEALFDLLEAVSLALEQAEGGPRPEPFLRRLFGRSRATGAPGDTGAAGDEAVWRGLAIAREEALDRLRRRGIAAAPTEGRFDPDVHRVVERLPVPDPARHGTLARTYRRGWVQQEGGGRRVLRAAHVGVYAGERDAPR